MRIAIAGAGNVGRSIAQELIENGHQVMLIERQPKMLRPERVPAADWVLADACELSSLEEADVAGCDVVVDFSAFPVGSEVTLVNAFGTGATRDVMRFVVTRTAADDTRIPARLVDLPVLTKADAVETRQFDFRFSGNRWTINSQPYDAAGSLASPRLGTVELWRFTSDFHHPVHVHLGHFQVLSRRGRDPEPWESGWKDTVDVRPYEAVEVLVKFEGHRGRYMLHCHNLEHEDMAMMANFDVV